MNRVHCMRKNLKCCGFWKLSYCIVHTKMVAMETIIIYPDAIFRYICELQFIIFNISKNILYTVQITFIFIGQTRLVFGKCVCTCVTKHSNAFRTFLNWLKNSKRVWHEPKLHISRLPLFANFDL